MCSNYFYAIFRLLISTILCKFWLLTSLLITLIIGVGGARLPGLRVLLTKLTNFQRTNFILLNPKHALTSDRYEKPPGNCLNWPGFFISARPETKHLRETHYDDGN